MTDLDVEPVEDADQEVEDGNQDVEDEGDDRTAEVTVDPVVTEAPDYVLYGGKGGVGKTTMAAATGLASANEGVRTLVVSTDPAHSLSDTYGTSIPSRPERIRDDIPLFAVEIDPDAAVEEAALFAQESDQLGGLGELLGEGGLAGSMPGADEAAAVQQLMELMDDDRFDRVVIDTAPTGHTLRLLELPEVMDSTVGRLLALRERIGGLMDGMTGIFGGEDPESGQAGTEDLQVVRERIERLRSILRDPTRTDFRVVMVPEKMSVVESERLLARLEEFEVPVRTVVVNRVMEDLVDVVDDRFEGEFASPNHADCEFCARRWEVQQDALARAQDLFRHHDVKRVPLFAGEVRGEESLRIVAKCLE